MEKSLLFERVFELFSLSLDIVLPITLNRGRLTNGMIMISPFGGGIDWGIFFFFFFFGKTTHRMKIVVDEQGGKATGNGIVRYNI